MFSSSASRSRSASSVRRTIAGMVGRPGALGRPPAPLPHHQLVAAADLTDDDRLKEPELAERVLQLGECILVEDSPRVAWVGPDLPDRQLLVPRTLSPATVADSSWFAVPCLVRRSVRVPAVPFWVPGG